MMCSREMICCIKSSHPTYFNAGAAKNPPFSSLFSACARNARTRVDVPYSSNPAVVALGECALSGVH